jgi:hypothetical protein
MIAHENPDPNTEAGNGVGERIQNIDPPATRRSRSFPACAAASALGAGGRTIVTRTDGTVVDTLTTVDRATGTTTVEPNSHRPRALRREGSRGDEKGISCSSSQ